MPVIDFYEKQGKLIRLNGNDEFQNVYPTLYKTILDLQKERFNSAKKTPTYNTIKRTSSRSSSTSSKISSRGHSVKNSRGSLSKRRSSKSLLRSKSKLNNGKEEFKNVFFVIGISIYYL